MQPAQTVIPGRLLKKQEIIVPEWRFDLGLFRNNNPGNREQVVNTNFQNDDLSY